MSTSHTEIPTALLDVRRAYRLLKEYQRAARDTVRYIGAQLGFDYRAGYPRFAKPADRHGKNAMECWSWDWLSLYHFDFNFYRTMDDGRELSLTMMLVSDTGFYISENAAAEQTSLDTFAPAEASGTKICFLLMWKADWRDEWNNTFWEKENFRRFLLEGGWLPEGISALGAIAKVFDYSQVADDISTEARIAELLKFAQDHNFPLERIDADSSRSPA